MLLLSDTINYTNLIKFSSLLYTYSEESQIYDALLHSIMGKLLANRAMLVLHTSGNKVTVLHSFGKNPFFCNSIDLPLKDIDISQIDSFYQHRYSFEIREGNIKLSLYFTLMQSNTSNLVNSQADYLELVTQIASSAISNLLSKKNLLIAEQQSRLNNFFLKALMQVNRDLISVTSVSSVVNIFYNTIKGQLGITKVALFIVDDDNNFTDYTNSFNVDFPDEMLSRFYHFDESANKKQLGINCELCNAIEHYIPVIHNGSKQGFILLGKKMSNLDFSDEEKFFAQGIASAAISAIINQQLIAEMIEKKNIEKELQIALEIQSNLMPKFSPIISGYSISADSIPSRQVGGDYYDIIQITEDKYLFIIADVSGKGIPASLLMANVQAACRVLAEHAKDLNELLNSVNQLVYNNTSADRFVTMFVCILDTHNNTLKYSNAGHNPPLYIKSTGDVKRLTKGGIILGLFDMPIEYQIETISLEENSITCLFTDGIIECPTNLDLELGEERLTQHIISNFFLPPAQIMNGIFSIISNTTDNKVNYDDQTIILIKRK